MSSEPGGESKLLQQFRRGLVPTKLGLVHYTAVGGDGCGSGDNDSSNRLLPIVGFHMSPRSVDEYKEIMLECCNNNRLFVAMDEFGYGCSDNPNKSCTLDDIADCFVEVLDFLRINTFCVCGSLMGCYIALSLASRYPQRVKCIVLSNLYYFQKDARDNALLKEQ